MSFCTTCFGNLSIVIYHDTPDKCYFKSEMHLNINIPQISTFKNRDLPIEYRIDKIEQTISNLNSAIINRSQMTPAYSSYSNIPEFKPSPHVYKDVSMNSSFTGLDTPVQSLMNKISNQIDRNNNLLINRLDKIEHKIDILFNILNISSAGFDHYGSENSDTLNENSDDNLTNSSPNLASKLASMSSSSTLVNLEYSQNVEQSQNSLNYLIKNFKFKPNSNLAKSSISSIHNVSSNSLKNHSSSSKQDDSTKFDVITKCSSLPFVDCHSDFISKEENQIDQMTLRRTKSLTSDFFLFE